MCEQFVSFGVLYVKSILKKFLKKREDGEDSDLGRKRPIMER
jgi:hypothetical protein